MVILSRAPDVVHHARDAAGRLARLTLAAGCQCCYKGVRCSVFSGIRGLTEPLARMTGRPQPQPIMALSGDNTILSENMEYLLPRDEGVANTRRRSLDDRW